MADGAACSSVQRLTGEYSKNTDGLNQLSTLIDVDTWYKQWINSYVFVVGRYTSTDRLRVIDGWQQELWHSAAAEALSGYGNGAYKDFMVLLKLLSGWRSGIRVDHQPRST